MTTMVEVLLEHQYMRRAFDTVHDRYFDCECGARVRNNSAEHLAEELEKAGFGDVTEQHAKITKLEGWLVKANQSIANLYEQHEG